MQTGGRNRLRTLNWRIVQWLNTKVGSHLDVTVRWTIILNDSHSPLVSHGRAFLVGAPDNAYLVYAAGAVHAPEF